MASKRLHANLQEAKTFGPFTDWTCVRLPQHDSTGFLKVTVTQRDTFPVIIAIPSRYGTPTVDDSKHGTPTVDDRIAWYVFCCSWGAYGVDLAKAKGRLICPGDRIACKDAAVKKVGDSIILGLRTDEERQECYIVRQTDEREVKLNFNKRMPMFEYTWHAVLNEKSSCQVEVIEGSRKHARFFADVSFQAMWECRDFTDCELVCNNGHRIKAHRPVLCLASPVFAAAFKGTMKEACTAQILLDDSRAEAVEAMLQAIYTGSLKPSLAIEILPLAHRYELHKIADQCLIEVLGSIGVDNVAEVVRVLRTFKDEGENFRDAWTLAAGYIAEDKSVTLSLMSAV